MVVSIVLCSLGSIGVEKRYSRSIYGIKCYIGIDNEIYEEWKW